jgi:hypothetical protein
MVGIGRRTHGTGGGHRSHRTHGMSIEVAIEGVTLSVGWKGGAGWHWSIVPVG